MLAVSLWAAAMGALAPTAAQAHFILQEPASWAKQDIFGLPQKSPPCGQVDTGQPPEPTNMVTAVRQGDKLTVTIQEVIFHPGHYRIAIAPDQSSLPADPPVTAGASPCGTTVIAANPTLPLLADGLLEHTSPFSGPQSVQVTIPANLPCTHCTLQVVEFMSDHPINPQGVCFYHHCANLTIEPPDAGVNPIDASASIPDAATQPPAHGGCMISAGRTSSVAGFTGLLPLVALLIRRRRR